MAVVLFSLIGAVLTAVHVNVREANVGFGTEPVETTDICAALVSYTTLL